MGDGDNICVNACNSDGSPQKGEIHIVEKIKIPSAVKKRDGTLQEFSVRTLEDVIASAARELGGRDSEESKRMAEEGAILLYEEHGKVVTPDEINSTLYNVLTQHGHDGTAWALRIRARKKETARERLGVMGGSKKRDTTDAFLMVGSTSKERSTGWDRKRIILSLINESNLPLREAESVAEEAETYVFGTGVPNITTQLIREVVHTELMKRDLTEAANLYRSFGIPRADLEKLIFSKIQENANITANNPEAINFGLSGGILKAFALSSIFSPDVAEAHSNGMVHLHDLDMPTRVYCSAHSLEHLKLFGLKLKNLNSNSGPSKHSDTLIGHLNTFLASMQAYYAGALGVADINVFLAPHLKKDLEIEAYKRINALRGDYQRRRDRVDRIRATENVSQLEKELAEDEQRITSLEQNPLTALSEKEIDDYLEQRAQIALYTGSQNAFSRGSQTLFLDFNLHAGVPAYQKETLAVLDGKYHLRDRNGKLVDLEKKLLEEKTKSGYRLMELNDTRTGKVVMREKLERVGEKEHLVQERFTEDGEKLDVYGDYEAIARRFTRAMLKKFGEGDEKGAPFAFPKCDFHVNEDTLTNPEDSANLDYACEIASKNGSVYFVMDRDAVTMSACCRLRTTIEDDYLLKHPESMRFCGFQNVTINLAQAAARAVRSGKKNLEGFLEEVDKATKIAVKAHLQKREFVERLQVPGGPQWQTGDIAADGRKYVDLNDSTYIIGLLGLNEALQFLFGKQLHEMSGEEMKLIGLRSVAHMNLKLKDYGKQYKMKFSLEESPAESATRRFALTDEVLFPELAGVIKGTRENPYYTNSIHLSADAPVDLITRIKKQAMFHPAIDSGAIIHAFVGEQRPPAASIRKLVEKTYNETQTAQLTISPEFTVCESCGTTTPRLEEHCSVDSTHSVYGVSRIIGYFSRIPNWNKSKLEELKKRHVGVYSVPEGEALTVPLNTDMPQLEKPSNPNELIGHRFGKPEDECKPCADLGRTLNSVAKMYAKQGVTVREVYHKVTEEAGLTEFLATGLNPSRVPAVVIMGAGGEIYRQQTSYDEKGRITHITAKDLANAIGSHVTAGKQNGGDS